MKLALIGNPNSGKTTLFNAITGRIEHVGNWPGVTVEKREGKIKETLSPEGGSLTAVDLPGAYSLSPFTREERIPREFILEEKPDVLINIVDADSLERSLFFSTQLLELGIPMVIALSKGDQAKGKGKTIRKEILEKELGCPVVETLAIKSKDNGLPELLAAAVAVGRKGPGPILSIPGVGQGESKGAVRESDEARFQFVRELAAKALTRSLSPEAQTRQDAWDRVIAHKWLGIPIFAGVIWLVFSLSQAWVGPYLADLLVGWLEGFQSLAADLTAGAHPLVQSLLVEGIIGGVLAVVGFLPLIMVMFFLLALLEDSGYMARVAVVMDRFFRKVGLSGRSVIPMIMSTACAIPGIMASRTIRDTRQRRTTAMLSPFMPCGAKLPVIALFSGVFFAGNAWVGTSMYLLGIVVILLSALIIRKITGDTSESYFIMELPDYRVPSLKRAAVAMVSRGKAFVVKAGTVILVSNALVHILQSFSWNLQTVGEGNPEASILASLAGPLAVLFIPLGFGVWQFTAAAVTGFIAKENVVGTLAVTFGITSFFNLEELALAGEAGGVAAAFAIGPVAALAYLIFNLFTPPCFAAIGAMRTELASTRWTLGAIGFQLSMGYILAFLTYQGGTFLTTGGVGAAFLPGLLGVLILAGIIAALMFRGKRNLGVPERA